MVMSLPLIAVLLITSSAALRAGIEHQPQTLYIRYDDGEGDPQFVPFGYLRPDGTVETYGHSEPTRAKRAFGLKALFGFVRGGGASRGANGGGNGGTTRTTRSAPITTRTRTTASVTVSSGQPALASTATGAANDSLSTNSSDSPSAIGAGRCSFSVYACEVRDYSGSCAMGPLCVADGALGTSGFDFVNCGGF